jgi:hypothetical protein
VKRKFSPTQTAVIDNTGPLNPEWLRIARIPAIYGLSRSHIWLKIQDGTLQSIHVRAPGATRGVRLVKVSSVKEYLNSFVPVQRRSKSEVAARCS